MSPFALAASEKSAKEEKKLAGSLQIGNVLSQKRRQTGSRGPEQISWAFVFN